MSPAASDWRPDIFEFHDYRRYLAAYYAAAKAHIPGFSHRRFADRAGYRSPVALLRVVDGRRRLTERGVEGFARAMELDEHEADHFRLLVEWADGPTAKRRTAARLQVEQRRQRRDASHTISGSPAHWFTPAVRALMAMPDYRPAPRWVADRLGGRLGVSEARLALREIRASYPVETAPRVASSRVATRGPEGAVGYHLEMLKAAQVAAEDDRPGYNCSLTFPVRLDRVADLRAAVDAFIERVADLSACTVAEEVYHVEVALFPLS